MYYSKLKVSPFLQCMFPLLPWELEMLRPPWLIIFGLCERERKHAITFMCWILNKNSETLWRFRRSFWRSCAWVIFASVRPGDSETSSTFHFLGATHNLRSVVTDEFHLFPHRSKRGSNGLDYDSKRWRWGHCLDTAGWELPQPLPPPVSLFHWSPVRHCVS